ncbi:MAG: metallophosphoesterase [Sporolactobacillus sp.]
MKLLIVSDTHGWKKELVDLRERYMGEVAAMIHCGDSERPADSPEMADYLAVEGNCDRPNAYPNERVVTFGELTVLVAHGHLAGVQCSPDHLIMEAKAADAQIICHGHTHFAGALKKDGLIIINPGSLRLPRNYFEGTYAILEQVGHNISIFYYNLKGERVDRFSTHLTID